MKRAAHWGLKHGLTIFLCDPSETSKLLSAGCQVSNGVTILICHAVLRAVSQKDARDLAAVTGSIK